MYQNGVILLDLSISNSPDLGKKPMLIECFALLPLLLSQLLPIYVRVLVLARMDFSRLNPIEPSELFKNRFLRMHIITVLIDVQSLELRTYTTSTEDEKLHKLLELLKIGGDSIVYATTQKDTVHISEALNSKLGDKSSIRTYHAGMKTETRNEVQEWFMNKTSVTAQKIVVCTIAFGMGIDKSDIRQVIHYKMPKNLEGYRYAISILCHISLTGC